MEGISWLVAALRPCFALVNLSGLTPQQRAEAIKQMAGLAASLGTMPQTAGRGFVEGSVAKLPGSMVPTSPANAAAGLARWQLDEAASIGGALQGDQAAADRAVEGISRLGHYMAGKGK